MPVSTYRGRFAPTPSGPLHLGSLLTALASYLRAKAAGGIWLLRIDDLDMDRAQPKAEDRILHQLEAHGLQWDETLRRQTRHLEEYRHAAEVLEKRGLTYHCRCTRAELSAQSLPGPDGPVYAGTCRRRSYPPEAAGLRLRVPDEWLMFEDGLQGLQRRQLDTDVGDFLIRRRDGMVGYQLACAIDEHAQGITEVVRGADLLGSTFRQLHLMHLLRLHPPAYVHLPVLVDGLERKLSKQNRAVPAEETRAAANLVRCLEWLGQRPAPALERAAPREILDWALGHWQAAALPRRRSIELRSL